jgi:all-trans-retinol dehydrogenase (NAD+)
MATPAPGGISDKALLPLTLLRKIAFEPFFTGPLLYILLRGSDDIRNRVLEPFRNNLLTKVQLSTVIKTVKWLFGLGLASRINQLLTNFTLNHGQLRHQGKGWNFDKGGKDEVILITGGCMGFGLNMVKVFSARAPLAKLIVLDVQDLPAELKNSALHLLSFSYTVS